jgi:hypothetical protein
MASLERAREDLDKGGQRLAGLAKALGGSLEEPAWATLTQIARTDPRATAFVLGLRPGQHSPPFRTATGIVMLRLVERRDPEPLPFAKAQEQVRDDFLAAHRHQQYAALSSELLAQARLQVVRPRLEEMLQRPLAAEEP